MRENQMKHPVQGDSRNAAGVSWNQLRGWLVLILIVCVSGCERTPAVPSGVKTPSKVVNAQETPKDKTAAKKTDSTVEAKDDDPYEVSDPVVLFDGKTLDGWETIEFGGEGDCYTENGVMTFEMGDPFTGICSTNEDLPTNNFEVSLSARKITGVDFMCGLTFPIDDSHCTLILGGWGGDVCGLSCIDDIDASSNETNTSKIFKKDQWYKIRLRVVPNHVTVWIDGEQLIDADVTGKKISLRGDTILCEPLGICSFQTQAEYKDIELRTLKAKQTK